MIDKITLPGENYNVPDYDEKLANKTNEIVEEVNDHSNKLLDLLARLGLIADYVIETGKNADGSYEKWHSGKLKQIKRASVNIPEGTAWGNLYYHDFTIGSWEVPFATIMHAKENVRNNTYWSNIAAYSTTSTGTIRAFRPTSGGATSVTVTVKGVGTWK